MPYYLYNTSTGKVTGGPYNAPPTNTEQLAALTAGGEAFISLPSAAVGMLIDLNTQEPIAQIPPTSYVFQYNYDPSTGAIGGWVAGNLVNTAIPVSKAGLVVATVPVPAFRDNGGATLTIDANGMPVLDANGNYQVTPLPLPDPPLLVQLTAALIANGTIQASQLGANTVTQMNAVLTTSNMTAVATTASIAKSAP